MRGCRQKSSCKMAARAGLSREAFFRDALTAAAQVAGGLVQLDHPGRGDLPGVVFEPLHTIPIV